jgi:hypothetical protein
MNFEQICEFDAILYDHAKLMPHAHYLWGSPSHGMIRYHIWDWDMWVDRIMISQSTYRSGPQFLRGLWIQHEHLLLEATWCMPWTVNPHTVKPDLDTAQIAHVGDTHILDQILVTWRLSQI